MHTRNISVIDVAKIAVVSSCQRCLHLEAQIKSTVYRHSPKLGADSESVCML